MTIRSWLNLAALVTALLILIVAFAAWRSANPLPRSAEEISAETAAQIKRIEARAAEMERNAAAP